MTRTLLERIRATGSDVGAEAERLLIAAQKDLDYHYDCRPNRREAEAAIADAKAMNDKWADEVNAHRETTDRLAALTTRLRAHEWAGSNGIDGFCPACAAMQQDGHFADCWLADLLKDQAE